MATLENMPWLKRRQREPIVVLTGAGVSMSAGLPGGRELSEIVLKTLCKNVGIDALPGIQLISKGTPLETIFQIVADHIGEEPIQLIISQLNKNAPSRIHATLAELARDKQISALYTFNFDQLHEFAFGSNPTDVVHFGRTIRKNFRLGHNWQVPLWKLHGSSDFVGIITISEYIRGFSTAVHNSLRRDLDDRAWLILGYGGWDVDFRGVIADAARSGVLPREVIWVDKSFPDDGSRSEILEIWNSRKVVTQLIEQDVDYLARYEMNGAPVNSKNHEGTSSALADPLKGASSFASAGAITEAALICGHTEIAAFILRLFAEDQLTKERALLAEKQGYRKDAGRMYFRLASESPYAYTKAMAAIKAFVLTGGSLDCFDKVETTDLGETGLIFFKAVATTRRTDTGGLDRKAAAEVLERLPSIENLIRQVTSLDGARFFISTLSEIARVFHETRRWIDALEMDQLAYRVAQGFGDLGVMGMCAGNIGSCYMGLAEDEQNKSKIRYLKLARRWLAEAVQKMRGQDEFGWALHTCNLGVVESELGTPQAGIDLLKIGLSSLMKIYPNYAVCFWGELAECYIFAARNAKGENRAPLTLAAVESLRSGLTLADRLRDWDDLSFLRNAANGLKKLNCLPLEFKWLCSEKKGSKDRE